MSAPIKPWERAGVNHQNLQNSLPNFSNQMSSGPTNVASGIAGRSTPMASSTAPPPIPTRPSQQRSGIGTGYGMGTGGMYGGGYGSIGSSYSPYGGLGGGYGSSMYGSGMYGGYGSSYGAGGYGGYGMNRYGPQEYTQNGFVRQAEDSSRQAFQSIESVVQAFGSVTMMLESTFYAVYNSFRAVIGVADNFSRLKSHFASIFSAFAALRALKWLYRKLLVLLRLREAGLDEDLWNSAAASALSGAEDLPGKPKSNWPVWFFFIVVIAGPYLIWRLLSSLAGDSGSKKWADGTAEHFQAEAKFDFEGEQDDELAFRRGQKIRIAPKELQPRMRGWLLASVDGKKTGIIPANYVNILGKQRGRRLSKQLERDGEQLERVGLTPAVRPPQPSESSLSLEQMDSFYTNPSGSTENFANAYPSSSGINNMNQRQSNMSNMVENKEAADILTDSKIDEEWPK